MSSPLASVGEGALLSSSWPSFFELLAADRLEEALHAALTYALSALSGGPADGSDDPPPLIFAPGTRGASSPPN